MSQQKDTPNPKKDTQPTTDKSSTTEKDTVEKPQSIMTGLVQGGPFYRSYNHKMLGGVFSGLAIRSGVNPDLAQLVAFLLFLVLFAWSSIAGIAFLVVYFILWLIIPMEPVSEEEKKEHEEKEAKNTTFAFRVGAVIIAIAVIAYFIATRGF